MWKNAESTIRFPDVEKDGKEYILRKDFKLVERTNDKETTQVWTWLERRVSEDNYEDIQNAEKTEAQALFTAIMTDTILESEGE